MNLFERCMEELKARGVYKYDEYGPFFVASAGCHIFNLFNQNMEVYFEAREVPSLRMHILFVAPPGFMKTFYMRQFLMGRYALLKGSGINIGLEQSLTGAGFVGTIQNVQGEIIITDGAAKVYADGILGIDEFSAITRALAATYNTELDTQLLAALDHGHVFKRLGSGKIGYETQLTLWAGVQPARFDLTSGMGRRFIYLVFFPTQKEANDLLDAWWKSKNRRPNARDLDVLRKQWQALRQEIKVIKKVEFDDDVLKMYRALRLYPYEGSYFDRLLIGYHITTTGPEEKMTIGLNDARIKKLVRQELTWRRQIMIDAEIQQVVNLLKDLGGRATKEELLEEAILIGLDLTKTSDVIERARRAGVIKIRGNEVNLP